MQHGALRRKIGGTYKDFFEDYVEVDGQYVEEGWVEKTCKVLQERYGWRGQASGQAWKICSCGLFGEIKIRQFLYQTFLWMMKAHQFALLCISDVPESLNINTYIIHQLSDLTSAIACVPIQATNFNRTHILRFRNSRLPT
ncbi:hypothetical protein ACFX2F_001559 [Malus domestica]